VAGAGPLGEFEQARADLLRAQLAFATNRGGDAPLLLVEAARRLEPVDTGLARATYLDALTASTLAGRLASPGWPHAGGGPRRQCGAAAAGRPARA
jgi:hypothetical protein